MLELLGLLGGGLIRLFPNVLDFFREGRDLKYELLRLDKQAELERMRGENRMQEIAAISNAEVDDSWAQGLVEALKTQTTVTGDKWLDRINVSVRPIITYWWCIVIYTSHKALLTYIAITEKTGLREVAAVIYTDFDRGVVGSIIGFWFVDRALRQWNKNSAR